MSSQATIVQAIIISYLNVSDPINVRVSTLHPLNVRASYLVSLLILLILSPIHSSPSRVTMVLKHKDEYISIPYFPMVSYCT